MSVYQRGAIWWVKFQVDGQTIRRSAETTKKRDALTFERNLRKAIEDDRRNLRAGLPVNRTISDALVKWFESGAPMSMASHAKQVDEYMGSVPLIRAVAAAGDMKAVMLKRQLSAQTINRRLAVVRRVLNLAYKQWEWIREPLGQRIELLSEKGLERYVFLTPEQVETLIGAMKNDEAKRFLLLAAYTGMRKSEIYKLAPDMWRSPIIYLPPKTKSGRPRLIPLVPELHPTMDSLPFTIHPESLRDDFERARKAVDMAGVRMHDLRHTFASWIAADPDTPLTVLRDLLGHSSLAVTSRYSHLKTEHAESAILRLSGHKSGHTAAHEGHTKPKRK